MELVVCTKDKGVAAKNAKPSILHGTWHTFVGKASNLSSQQNMARFQNTVVGVDASHVVLLHWHTNVVVTQRG